MKPQTKFKQTEIGMIPEDWEELPAKEFCIKVTDGTHDSPKKQKSGKYLVTSRHIKEGKLDFDNAYFITESDFNEVNKRSKVNQWDLIFGMIGTIGEIYLEKNENPDYAIKNVGLFKTNSELKGKWLFYYLKSPKARDYIFRHSAGTTQQYMTLDSLRNFPIRFPKSKEEQKSIAKILSSLDAKIELNNKMNKTLEAIGQALFKKWFMEERKGEWKEGKLGDLVKNIKNPLKPGEEIKGRKYVPIDLLSMKKISIDSFLPYTEAKSSLVGFEKDDILLGAMRVYFHRVNIAPFSGVTRSTTFVLRPVEDYLLSYSLFLINQDSTINYANSNSKGSTMPYAVWNNSLENMPCLIPPEENLKEFHKLVYPMISKIRDSLFNIQTLAQIRDLLLPKLMSGKIWVSVE